MKRALAVVLAVAVFGTGAGCDKQHASGDFEARLKKLEDNLAKREEALAFLDSAYEQQKKQREAQEENEPDPDTVFAVDIDLPIKAGQVEGPANALVTIVEAWDFAWPHCQRVSSILDELVKDYGGKVRVVYMNFVVHPQQVQMAHQYGCAAAKQGKFLAWKTAWWDKAFATHELSVDNILRFSADLGLDTQKLKADAEGSECQARVAADQRELERFHVNGTPGFFINGKFTGGGMPKAQFKEIIDERLKVAEASGVPGRDYYQNEIFGKGEKQFRSKKQAKKPTPK